MSWAYVCMCVPLFMGGENWHPRQPLELCWYALPACESHPVPRLTADSCGLEWEGGGAIWGAQLAEERLPPGQVLDCDLTEDLYCQGGRMEFTRTTVPESR